MTIFKKYFFGLFFLCLTFLSSNFVYASGDEAGVSYQARIVKIVEEKKVQVMGREQLFQRLELKLNTPDQQIVVIENGAQPLVNVIRYAVNDNVLVSQIVNPDGSTEYVITDFVRHDSLFLLFLIMIVLLVVIAKWKGFFSLFGMAYTFVIVFFFILPRLLAGDNPVFIAITSSVLIIPVSFYLSHGFNKKTTIAIIGSLISLTITAILASVFINISHLTGLSSEEAGMLSVDQGNLNMKGILLAGIVIGALGVLDDITISQSAIVDELATTANLTHSSKLYSRAMVIGKDHITSMVNTLVLAYAGASLPLLLIFTNNPHPFSEIINYEIIAEEIVRTLVGSIGLIIAVPVTTFIAAVSYKKS